MKKIAIFGSREINTKAVIDILNEIMSKEVWYITSGNIKGVAECARMVAAEKGIKITLYNYESGLGFYTALKDITIKNKKMVHECDEALVFWNGESKGTEREIKMLNKNNKPYKLFRIDKEIKSDFFGKQLEIELENTWKEEFEKQKDNWGLDYK